MRAPAARSDQERVYRPATTDTGSVKCSCRWSTYSIHRPSVVPAHRDEVEHREVLHHLAQADAAGVRAHRHAELGGEQDDGQVLVDPADPAGVDLHDVDRLAPAGAA